jgi:3-hydroxymyristoyl/3-hydroxydecanoyl-(acyl carrier protein) dehydratase
MRFYHIDRIDEICYDKYITGTKCITLSDDVFNEHFPGYPIFPGSLLMESMAQLAGSFFEIMMKEKALPQKQSVLSIVNKMKFKKPAEPGDRVICRADIKVMRDDYGVAAVKAEIDEELCATGELTFSFITVNDEKLIQSRKDLYKICMKNTRVISE